MWIEVQLDSEKKVSKFWSSNKGLNIAAKGMFVAFIGCCVGFLGWGLEFRLIQLLGWLIGVAGVGVGAYGGFTSFRAMFDENPR